MDRDPRRPDPGVRHRRQPRREPRCREPRRYDRSGACRRGGVRAVRDGVRVSRPRRVRSVRGRHVLRHVVHGRRRVRGGRGVPTGDHGIRRARGRLPAEQRQVRACSGPIDRRRRPARSLRSARRAQRDRVLPLVRPVLGRLPAQRLLRRLVVQHDHAPLPAASHQLPVSRQAGGAVAQSMFFAAPVSSSDSAESFPAVLMCKIYPLLVPPLT